MAAPPTGRRSALALLLLAGCCLLLLADAAAGPGGAIDGPVALLGLAIGGYAVGAWVPRRVALPALAAAVVVLTMANQLWSDEYHWLDDLVFSAIVVLGPALAGAALVARARQVRELSALAEELAAQRRAAVTTARLEEQNRVHEQVHRRLSERVGAIALRADGAQRATAPVAALAALSEVETVARLALDELRAALGSLREPDPPEASTEPVAIDEPARPSLTAADLAMPLCFGLGLALEVGLKTPVRGPLWANIVAVFLVAAPLLVCRRHPLGASVASLGAAVVMTHWLTPVTDLVVAVGLLVFIGYTLGAWSRGSWGLLGLVTLWAGVGALTLTTRAVTPGAGDGLAPMLVVSTLSVGMGALAAGWRRRASQAAATVSALERGRSAEVRLAVARERQAIASTLHDTMAHAMTVVCLQAGAAQRHSNPVLASQALATIAETARAGLTELRDSLDAMAEDEGPLDASRIAAAAHGIGVRARVDAGTGPALRGAEAALLFRIVREALVNVARHAPGADCTVRLSRQGDTAQLEVLDGGNRGPAEGAGFPHGTGTGLAGLRSALAAAGGELTWGPLPTKGFAVRATLPLRTRTLVQLP